MTSELDKRHKAKVDKLSTHSGAEFDKNYMDAMIADHKADIKKFEQQSEKAKDADLKKFATETLPILDIKGTPAARRKHGQGYQSYRQKFQIVSEWLAMLDTIS